MTVPDIIQAVFRELGFTDFDNQLSGQYREWEYCVQYRETDFDFVSRLMEQEGIYYYFRHEPERHILVLADAIGSHRPTPGYEEVPFFPPDEHQFRRRDHLFEWSVHQEVQPGHYVLNDFDFKKPKADLIVKATVSRHHQQAEHEIYDYPGEYEELPAGTHYVQARIEERHTEYEQVWGKGSARGLAVGALFKLTDYPLRQDLNREYLIVSSTHTLTTQEYETKDVAAPQHMCLCEITAVDSRQQYRPRCITPKPVVHGPQTAIVVGPAGEEIWTDRYGRVKVQFHWDRYGQRDENSSCWIRVSQLWAGKQWGGIQLPRIGQEVIVEFLEGDPDRPIITGRVYNADQMPPYDLPGHQTQSGVKSRSSKQGTASNFNELRFEDKIGAEEVYFHAERDFARVVENNDTLRVGFEKKQAGDQTIDVQHHRTKTVHQGDDSLTVKMGNHSIKVNLGSSTIEALTGIKLKCGLSSISLTPASITIDAPLVTIKGLVIRVEAETLLRLRGRPPVITFW
jgi:type VI secretion system secreted protein VgrG